MLRSRDGVERVTGRMRRSASLEDARPGMGFVNELLTMVRAR